MFRNVYSRKLNIFCDNQYAFKKKSNKNPQNQNYIKDFFFLFLIVAFHVVDDVLPYLDLEINYNDDEKIDTS